MHHSKQKNKNMEINYLKKLEQEKQIFSLKIHYQQK
jgi:hypothetical protein